MAEPYYRHYERVFLSEIEMEKTTVLARLRVSLGFGEEARAWLRGLLYERGPDSAWFASDEGDPFLSEFGGTWQQLFIESAEPEVQRYFRDLGVPSEHLPQVMPGETYRGSWVLEAAVVIAGSVGMAYQTLKGVSELPDIAEGLTKLKDRIVERFRPRANSAARKQLSRSVNAHGSSGSGSSPIALPQHEVLEADLVIDARPVLSLTPALLKEHRLHLSVGISRVSFTLENLGDESIQDIRLGLFRTASERHEWAYRDAYTAEVPLLSGGQTINKSLVLQHHNVISVGVSS